MSNNKYKILVIEDEANIRSFMDTILESNGYQPLSASTCAEGKLMFSSHRPDLVILDLGLPDEDGPEFIRFARQTSTAAIIVLGFLFLNKKKGLPSVLMGMNPGQFV